MTFVDTHAHLHFPDYAEDREQVMGRAKDAGVEFFVNVGTDVASSRQSLALAEQYPNVWATAGVHPHDSTGADEAALKEIEGLLKHPRMVAIGEVGLDFFRDHSPKDTQVRVFREFIKLHQKTGKPLVIHCRDAYTEMAAVFKEYGNRFKGIMHCFSSDKDAMMRFLELGFHISFAGPLTYKKNDSLREACKACPADRLLLETDAPFLPPQSLRGKRNEPAYLLETARTAAELHGLSLEDLGKRTTANARAVLGLC